MPSSAVPHLASRVPLLAPCFKPLARALAQPALSTLGPTRDTPLTLSPQPPALTPRRPSHTHPMAQGPPMAQGLAARGLVVAPAWRLGGDRGGAWVGPGRLSGVCMPMPMPMPMCRVCACACRERLPPSASGVAAAPAQRSDARRRRERPEDGRAGELAGHSTLCLSRCSLPQSGLQPAAEPGAEPGAGRVRGRWAGAPAGSRRSRSLPRSTRCAVALPCRQLRPRRPTQAPAMRAAG